MFVTLVAAACADASLGAQPAPGQQAAIVTLDTGETLRGQVVERAGGTLVLNHQVLGRLSIPQGRVAQTTIVTEGGATDPQASAPPATPPAQPQATVAQVDAPAAAPGPQQVRPPLVERAPPAWKASLEFGLSGSQGNTEQLLARGGFTAARDTDMSRLGFEGTYRRRTTNGSESENRLFFRGRQEFKRKATVLRPFLEESFEYDEFRAFDWRGRVAGGLAYPLLESDRTRLTGRLGGGLTKDFGGPAPDTYPEGLAQLEVSHRITERVSLAASTLYLPDLKNLDEYRWENRARMEFSLNETKSLLLSVGFEDRYESDAAPAVDKNDLDYFVTLVYRF